MSHCHSGNDCMHRDRLSWGCSEVSAWHVETLCSITSTAGRKKRLKQKRSTLASNRLKKVKFVFTLSVTYKDMGTCRPPPHLEYPLVMMGPSRPRIGKVCASLIL